MSKLRVYLLTEKDNLDSVLNSLTDGIFSHDKEMNITYFNSAAERITGFSREEALGKKCSDLFQIKLCGEECLICKTGDFTMGLMDHPTKIIRKNGAVSSILVSTTPLKDRQGNIHGGVAVLRDMTELISLREKLQNRYSFGNLIGKNYKMQEIYAFIEDIADIDATVLIQGESGTGKELVANAIHYHSRRAKWPFIKVNCSSFAENLLESELFGHVKGAFTGAIRDKAGRFELAHGGTIFLDEIGDTNLTAQVKLLRVLQEKVIEKVGDSKPIKVDVRIIAATNKDLKELVRQEKFREDLFYRIYVAPMYLSPLRDRKEDIPLLVKHFIDKFNKEMGKKILSISPKALDLLMDYNWKGNVRELENAMEYSFIKCRGKYILPEHLSQEIANPELPAHPNPHREKAFISSEVLTNTLKETGWNKTTAAKRLGIHRTTLWRQLKKQGVTLQKKGY